MGNLPSWIVPAVSLFAAIIVALANVGVQVWRYKSDRVTSAIELLCREINEAADMSTEYWLQTGSYSASGAQSFESRLIGRQMRLQALFVALKVRTHRLNLSESDQILLDLFDQMTGDAFGNTPREPNFSYARLVQKSAANLNGALRRAR